MATKKITELPFINTLSGSSVFDNPSVNSVVPVVLYGTTNQITVENFSKFTNLYAAQTGSQNTFTAQNIFNQNQWFNAIVSASTINVGTLGVGGNTTIVGTLGVTGNGTIGGNLAVAGRITAEEFYTEITTASVIYASGSTKFGDDTGDKHQFTGSINVSGSVIYNGVILSNIDANTIERLQQTTQSLQVATASLQAFSSSVNDQLQRVYQTTQSLHVATASLQFHSASVDSQLLAIQQTTQSLQVATASLNAFTASQDSRNYVISQFTSSTDAHIVGISAFTSSQLAVNLGNSIYTASVDSHIVGISTYTSSVRDTLARVHQTTQSLHVATASLQQFTASQDSRNFVVSQVTGSLIGITNGLMAFTAALDNTYATDAQLYQLYQSTRSLELHSGSMIGVTNGLMAYTASNTSLNTGLRGEVDGIEAYTASLKGQAIVSSSTQVQNYDVFALNSNLYTSTGSLIGITNGLMAFTAALDSTYATDAQLFQLYQATRSIELTTGSLIGITNGLMAFTAALDSTYATDAQLYQLYAETASMKGEIAGIESYTASLKGAAIVSSSQQIIDYNTFAVTSSANTFYGNQTISGSLRVNGPIRGNIITGGLDVNGGITGSVRGNLAGVADYAATVAVSSVGTTTDTSLFPTFTTAPVLASYVSLYSHSSSSFFLNGVTRRVHMEGFVVSGSNNIAEISGSLNVTGSITINSGSITMPNRPAFRVVGTGSTDRVAQTTLSGSYLSIDYNEGNHYNNSTGIFTAPLTGLYNVYYNGRCGSVNAQQQVIIYKNGATGTAQLMWEAPGNTGVAHFGVSGVFKLVAGDTLEAKVAVGSIQFDGNDTWGAAYIG